MIEHKQEDKRYKPAQIQDKKKARRFNVNFDISSDEDIDLKYLVFIAV